MSRGIFSGLAGYTAGRLSQSLGLGEFTASLMGALASAYTSDTLSTTFGSSDGFSSLGHISESHNGHLLEVEIAGFDRQQFNTELLQIKETIFEKAMSDGITTTDAVEIAEIQTEEIAEEIVEFKKKANEVETLAREATESSPVITSDQEDSTSPDQALQVELLLNRPLMQPSPMEDQLMDCLDRLAFAQLELSPREQVEAMVPRNKSEAAAKRATLLRYDMEDFIARNPNAAEWCGRIFVGSMYALQGVEYGGAFVVSGPVGVAGRFAVQETAGHAIEHGVDASSRETARLITDNPVLQQEFADTLKCTAYAGLCIGSAKASKKLVSTLARGALKTRKLALLDKKPDTGNVRVTAPAKLLPEEIPVGRKDYRVDFLHDLGNFQQGTSKLHHGPLVEDLCLVRYYDCNRELRYTWATHVSDGNKISTLTDLKQRLALLAEWGDRNTVDFIRIPKGTDTTFISGRVLQKKSKVEKLPGGGFQIRFRDFDPNWVVETMTLPK